MRGSVRASGKHSRTPDVKAMRRAIFVLASEMEEPLDQAMAFTGALDLMGFGLRGVNYDFGRSFLAVVETLTYQLEAAKTAWRRGIEATADESNKREPPNKMHGTRKPKTA